MRGNSWSQSETQLQCVDIAYDDTGTNLYAWAKGSEGVVSVFEHLSQEPNASVVHELVSKLPVSTTCCRKQSACLLTLLKLTQRALLRTRTNLSMKLVSYHSITGQDALSLAAHCISQPRSRRVVALGLSATSRSSYKRSESRPCASSTTILLL